MDHLIDAASARYDPEADVSYLIFDPGEMARSEEVAPCITLELDDTGGVIVQRDFTTRLGISQSPGCQLRVPVAIGVFSMPPHSCRKATTGSTFIARRAGK